MPRRKASTRISEALAIRDAALNILRTRGSNCPKPGEGTSWQADGMNFLLRTPFQPIPAPDGRFIRRAALFGLRYKPNLPYGLDIWEIGRGKVLNIEWTRDGRSELVGFRRGDWERKVLALGQSLDSGCSPVGTSALRQ